MMMGTREVIRASHPYLGEAPPVPVPLPVPTRRRDARVAEQRLCAAEMCESIDGETAVIRQNRVYSLNRSAHGILILMGCRPRTLQLLGLHIPESRWRRSLQLYEVRWTKPVHVDALGDLFLVGCRKTRVPSRH